VDANSYYRESMQRHIEARQKRIRGIIIFSVVVAVAVLLIWHIIPEHRNIRAVKNTLHPAVNMTFEEILEGYCTNTRACSHY